MKQELPVLFDLNDFRQQIVQMKKMGSVKDLMGKIPGMSQMASGLDGVDADGEVKRIQGIIDSMTMAERAFPRSIDVRRKRRIAKGAGVSSADVSGLMKQFYAIASFVKEMDTLRNPSPESRRRRDSGDRDDDCASPVPRP